MFHIEIISIIQCNDLPVGECGALLQTESSS